MPPSRCSWQEALHTPEQANGWRSLPSTMWCSSWSDTRYTTSSWRTDRASRTRTSNEVPEPASASGHHRRRPGGRLRAGLLLRSQRRGSGLHPEDLLSSRPPCDLRARGLRRRGDSRDPSPAEPGSGPRRPRVRLDSPLGHLRGGGAPHGLDLGARLVGQVVGLGRADAGQLPDRLSALRDLLPASLRDRGPGPAGTLRIGVRDHRGRLRAAELHGGARRSIARPPTCLRDRGGGHAIEDVDCVRGLPGRHGASVDLLGPLRARRQVGLRQPLSTASIARGRDLRHERLPNRAGRSVPRAVPRLMPALPLDEAGKYVAAAYIVFLALVLAYVAIMAAKLQRIERELGERVALTEGRATGVLNELVEAAEVQEAAAISTCNRTELYLAAPDPVGAESRAYELALVEGATGPILNRLFRGALAAGKRARSETGITERGVSVPSVAVELAQRSLGDLSSRLVLVVGAGETAELTARALAARGVEPAFIANRRYDRAIGLAQRFGGRAVRFDELPEQLAAADIVVASTSSPHHVIEREALTEVMAARGGRQLLLIDLAVPRD